MYCGGTMDRAFIHSSSVNDCPFPGGGGGWSQSSIIRHWAPLHRDRWPFTLALTPTGYLENVQCACLWTGGETGAPQRKPPLPKKKNMQTLHGSPPSWAWTFPTWMVNSISLVMIPVSFVLKRCPTSTTSPDINSGVNNSQTLGDIKVKHVMICADTVAQSHRDTW